MENFDAILDKAAELGGAYARAEQQNGATEPREAPLSGEWADDPTPREVARNAGYFEDDDPEIQDEIATAWENGYFDTWRHEG